jgi:hypothetical protein
MGNNFQTCHSEPVAAEQERGRLVLSEAEGTREEFALFMLPHSINLQMPALIAKG